MTRRPQMMTGTFAPFARWPLGGSAYRAGGGSGLDSYVSVYIGQSCRGALHLVVCPLRVVAGQKPVARDRAVLFARRMRIAQWDPADEKTTLACFEAHCAASRTDDPVEPPMSAGIFRVYLAEGFDHDPGETWVGYDDAGAGAGFYR